MSPNLHRFPAKIYRKEKAWQLKVYSTNIPFQIFKILKVKIEKMRKQNVSKFIENWVLQHTL